MSPNCRYSAGRNFSFRHLSITAKSHYRAFERAVCVVENTKERNSFLINCREEQVIPRTIHVPLRRDFHAFHPVKRAIIFDRIESAKSELNNAYKTARRCYNKLRFFFQPPVVQILSDLAYKTARLQAKVTRER